MPDYARGKIYKITSGDMTYIGSTTEPTLAKRMASHVSDYKKWKAGKRGNVMSFQLIETGQYDITLLELCPCGSKDELTARERFHIETNVCVNKCIPGRTKHEWTEDNKEVIAEYNKAYYQSNKQAILEAQKAYNDIHKEVITKRKKAYRVANLETFVEKDKVYYQANKELILERAKAYRVANRDKINAKQRERKSLL